MKRHLLLILTACLAVAITSFLATLWAAPAATTSSPLGAWLAVTPVQQQEIALDDPTFQADSAALDQTVRAARDSLATMLEAPGTPDADILAQVDRVSDAEHQLQRRITQYVLRIRPHLTAQQQLRLMGLCANGFRGQGYGRGMGRMGGMGPMGAPGIGRGPRGFGYGRGRAATNPASR